MAAFAYAFQLPVIAVVDAEGKIRAVLQVLYVVHDRGLGVPAISFACLALFVIKP